MLYKVHAHLHDAAFFYFSIPFFLFKCKYFIAFFAKLWNANAVIDILESWKDYYKKFTSHGEIQVHK